MFVIDTDFEVALTCLTIFFSLTAVASRVFG